jgi:hypothetical protein
MDPRSAHPIFIRAVKIENLHHKSLSPSSFSKTHATMGQKKEEMAAKERKGRIEEKGDPRNPHRETSVQFSESEPTWQSGQIRLNQTSQNLPHPHPKVEN